MAENHTAHEAGYRAFRDRGLSARNPFLVTDERNFEWSRGYDKARRESNVTAKTEAPQ